MITDPVKLGVVIRATDLLLGRDNYARRWVTHYRKHPTESKYSRSFDMLWISHPSCSTTGIR
jgi:hypothetical protein